MYLCLGQDDDENDGCKKPGNPLCNPGTWKGYSNGCCSVEEQCGEEEGDCNQDSECFGSLICMPNSCPRNKGFHNRADCCQQPSGSLTLCKLIRDSFIHMQEFMTYNNAKTQLL